jgi:hypothetical protein
MTDLYCGVSACANNRNRLCCRPDIMVGGPDSVDAKQTYCANFLDRSEKHPKNSVDNRLPNPSLMVHCEVTNCTYNEDRACSADHIEIRTTQVNNGQIKTECATFETDAR